MFDTASIYGPRKQVNIKRKGRWANLLKYIALLRFALDVLTRLLGIFFGCPVFREDKVTR